MKNLRGSGKEHADEIWTAFSLIFSSWWDACTTTASFRSFLLPSCMAYVLRLTLFIQHWWYIDLPFFLLERTCIPMISISITIIIVSIPWHNASFESCFMCLWLVWTLRFTHAYYNALGGKDAWRRNTASNWLLQDIGFKMSCYGHLIFNREPVVPGVLVVVVSSFQFQI